MNNTRRSTAFCVLGLLIGSQPMPVAAADVYRVGMLSLGGATGGSKDFEAFRDRLNSLGYAEGRNLVIERRSAEGQFERLPALAAELVRLNVDVIVTITTPAAQAAKAATSTIPIVMAGSADPVGLGLVASLARPGANLTGVTNSLEGINVKQLQLLKEAAPRSARVAVIMTRSSVEVTAFEKMQAASAALGVAVVAFNSESSNEIDLEGLSKLRADAVEAGGLMSYWTNWLELRRHAAVYVDKILNGARPADLPVEQPTRFELVINLKTAKALGITIPQSELLRADEVIQ